MRLVVDSNQLDSIRKDQLLTCKEKRNIQLVLPYRVYSEQQSARNAENRLCTLLDYNLRFGLSWREVLDALAGLTEAQIQGFDPLIRHRCDLDRRLKRHLRSGPDAHHRASDEFGRNGDAFEAQIQQIMASVRKRENDDRSRGITFEGRVFETPKFYYAWMIKDENRPMASVILNQVTNKGQRTLATTSRMAFIRAIDANPYCRRFLLFFAAMHLGWTNRIEDPKLKGSVACQKTDLTDMTLALYARSGDVILTNDKKFVAVFEFVDPSHQVQVCTWEDWVNRRR